MHLGLKLQLLATVDGSEIRLSPVDLEQISHYLQVVSRIAVGVPEIWGSDSHFTLSKRSQMRFGVVWHILDYGEVAEGGNFIFVGGFLSCL